MLQLLFVHLLEAFFLGNLTLHVPPNLFKAFSSHLHSLPRGYLSALPPAFPPIFRVYKSEIFEYRYLCTGCACTYVWVFLFHQIHCIAKKFFYIFRKRFRLPDSFLFCDGIQEAFRNICSFCTYISFQGGGNVILFTERNKKRNQISI